MLKSSLRDKRQAKTDETRRHEPVLLGDELVGALQARKNFRAILRRLLGRCRGLAHTYLVPNSEIAIRNITACT